MAGVRLEGVWKVFGKVVAVRDVSLVVEDGEFASILGPSGSGKTTLLYLIAGIYKPTQGRIYFGERDVTDLPPNQRNVGLVFQNYALYPHMTVFENIAFPLRLRRVPGDVVREKVLEAAKLLGIEGLLDRLPGQLSGGQQQRVALARALVKEPEVLLLDEPLSNLDALLRIRIRSELKRLQSELGITAIYVTHDQSEALAMADKVAVMSEGVLQQVGTPREVYEKPRNVFVASFIGSPPANLITVKLSRDRRCIELPGGETHCPPPNIASKLAQLPTDHVILGFRPENSVLSEEPLGDHIPVKAEVYTVELLGRENVVTLTVDGHHIKTVVPPMVNPSPGDEMYVNIEPSKALYFDPETEINLEYIEAAAPAEALRREAQPRREEAEGEP
ncbi:MAG: ABC transporter ATP-binding protein [Aeropyrum sp.]|nr:ABC transporter ATP-binding protein [Aeropyrum sp.]MCE4615672.1 ABC transporter ATP-binding protein [Aeropyrum sp.]